MASDDASASRLVACPSSRTRRTGAQRDIGTAVMAMVQPARCGDTGQGAAPSFASCSQTRPAPSVGRPATGVVLGGPVAVAAGGGAEPPAGAGLEEHAPALGPGAA